MTKVKYIISSAAIVNGSVYKDQERLFNYSSPDLNSFLLEIYNQGQFNYPKYYKMDQLSKLGWLTSEILLQGNGWIKDFKPEEISLVFCNSNASLDTDIKYYQTVKDFASPALFVYTLPNIVMGEISIRNNFKGENGFFIFNKFDPDFLELYVNVLMDDQTKICLCGWIDVLENQYQSVLFLLGESRTGTDLPFNSASMNEYYEHVLKRK